MQTKVTTKSQQLSPDEIGISFAYASGRPVKYYDDGIGPLWLYRDASGLLGIVRAQKWEDAYEIVEDEFLPVVPADEIHEAYGMTKEEFEAKSTSERHRDNDWPELVEGYSYQSNEIGRAHV